MRHITPDGQTQNRLIHELARLYHENSVLRPNQELMDLVLKLVEGHDLDAAYEQRRARVRTGRTL